MTDPDSERDAGFCSGADEDDMSVLHSPSASEDSVEVNVTAISSLRNKRKLVEPRKFEELTDARPLKKRRRYETEAESARSICDEETRSEGSPQSPFRPWSDITPSETKKHFAPLSAKCEGSETEEAQNLSLDIKREEEVLLRLRDEGAKSVFAARSVSQPVAYHPISYESLNEPCKQQEEPLSLVLRAQYPPRVPSHPAIHLFSSSSSSSVSSSSNSSCSMAMPLTNHPTTISSATSKTTATKSAIIHGQATHTRALTGQQRNYKNMTRERRIEANARERTRVHTISAAFDTLRRAIPAYSHNQKLSKLSVLRIACSYIMTLGKIIDKSQGQNDKGKDSLEACVDLVSKTIQTEGKLRKKKED